MGDEWVFELTIETLFNHLLLWMGVIESLVLVTNEQYNYLHVLDNDAIK